VLDTIRYWLFLERDGRYETRYVRFLGLNIEITYRPDWLESLYHELFNALNDDLSSVPSKIENLRKIVGSCPDLTKAEAILKIQRFKNEQLP
jgi:hypothetical protein